MTLTWTRFKDHHATQKHVVIQSWSEFIKTIQASGPYPNKKVCPWLKLAQFGEKRTDKNSLRHDGNMLDITGIEGDYDGEVLHPDAAIKLLEAAGIKCLIYTSASHTVDKPRWRVLAPLSRSFSPQDRSALLGRVNGVLGGVLSNESFTLSQGYFYGAVEGGAYRVLTSFDDPEEGSYLDELDELDNIAVFPHRTKSDPNPPGGTIAETFHQLGRKLKAGDQRRDMVRSYIATQSNRAVPAELISTLVQSTVEQYFDPADPVDWSDINQMIQTFTQHDIKQRQTDKVAMDNYVVRVKAKLAARAQAEEDEQVRLAESVGEDEPVQPTAVFKLKRSLADFKTLKPTKWVLDGFLAAGEVTVFAGQPGVGKSTIFAALSMIIAGFQVGDSNLAVQRTRRIAIVSEHPEQYARIIFGFIDRYGLDEAVVSQQITLFDSARLRPREISREIDHVIEQCTDEHPPLVILDTSSASFELSDENSNSEVSAVMAAIKVPIATSGIAMWIVCHAAKALGREDSEITPRGASSYIGDAHGTCSVFRDKGFPNSIFIKSLKNRSERSYTEIRMDTEVVWHTVLDEYDIAQESGIRLGTLYMSGETDRAEAAEKAKQEDKSLAANLKALAFEQRVKDVLIESTAQGLLLSASALVTACKRNSVYSRAQLAVLVDRGVVMVHQMPPGVSRTNALTHFHYAQGLVPSEMISAYLGRGE